MGILGDLFGAGLGDGIKRQRTLSWHDLDVWMRTSGNPENVGRGHIGSRLPNFRNSYVEVRRTVLEKGWRVEATLVLDPRQGVAVQKQIWLVSKLEAQVEQRFAGGNRFRVAT